jgi:hypothetical protein
VKDGYGLVRVVRRDGSVVSGILAQESASSLSLRDAADNLVTIPTAQVQTREVLPGSLMPAGLMAQLTRDEFVDLTAFLAALGDDPAFTVPRAAHARRWRTLAADDTAAARLRDGESAVATRGDTGLNWLTVYGTAGGALPLEDLPVHTTGGDAGYSFVRFDVVVEEAGTVALDLGTAAGLTLWLGDRELALAEARVSMDLAVGSHRFTLGIDRERRAEEPLMIFLDEEASTARATFAVENGE